MARRKPPFRLKHRNGTYYQRMSAVGPMFGGTWSQAATFTSVTAALVERAGHWAFVGSHVEDAEGRGGATHRNEGDDEP